MNFINPTFIIIPTYNEKENIENLIHDIFKLNIANLNILIVDDNSPDQTSEIVKNLIKQHQSHLHLIQRPKKLGLGSAYVAGFKYALEKNANLIFQVDGDFSHDPKYIPEFIKQINNGFDVVLGSRKINGGKIIGWNWKRKLISSGAMFVSRKILKLKTKDVTNGFRCYTKKTLTKINLEKIKSNGYAFQEEMIYLCEKNKFKIKEIPTTFIDRKLGKSKLNHKDAIEFFKTILRLKFLK
jgi:dolichol-phosphate mannosyltransferase